MTISHRQIAEHSIVKAVLRGHSGAEVTIHQEGHLTFVRKLAIRPETNDRLSQQCDKQDRFAAAGVSAAKVLGSGHLDGRFFFDMEYLPGISVASDISTNQHCTIETITDLIGGWTARMLNTVDGNLDAHIIPRKLDSILRNCQANDVLEDVYPHLALVIAELQKRPWPILPNSDCHGDFTLENMIVGTDQHIHLIDFDVPDIPSLWMDLGKLYQDVLGFWCIRTIAIDTPASVDYRNAAQALRRVRIEIDKVVGRMLPNLMPHLPALAALNLLRTLPYCREPAVADYVIHRIGEILR